MEEERKLREADDDIKAKLDHIFCRKEAFINDKKFKYVLVTNDVCKDSCCGMKDHSELDWAKSIEWQAVFDFNPNTLKDGLGHAVKDSKEVLSKPCFVKGN